MMYAAIQINVDLLKALVDKVHSTAKKYNLENIHLVLSNEDQPNGKISLTFEDDSVIEGATCNRVDFNNQEVNLFNQESALKRPLPDGLKGVYKHCMLLPGLHYASEFIAWCDENYDCTNINLPKNQFEQLIKLLEEDERLSKSRDSQMEADYLFEEQIVPMIFRLRHSLLKALKEWTT